MTTLTRPRRIAGEGEEQAAIPGSWDPLIRPIARLTLLVALILNSGALAGKPGFVMPNTVPLLVGIAALGIALTLPRDRAVVVPLGAVGILVMCLVSVLWSQDPDSSILWVRSSGMVALGIVVLVLVLRSSDTIAVLKAYILVVLLITLVAVAIEPLARVHVDPLGMSPDLKGWHGYFVHKNIMSSFLVFALATVLAFDKNRWTRWPQIAAIAFLFVVSDSTTGRMAALVLVAVQLWFTTNRRLSERSSAALAVSTAALMAVIGVAIGASLSAIADVAGKDLTFTGRTQIWSASWRAFLREPIFGHGVLGLFGTPHTVETAAVFREIGFVAGHPHNGLLDVAVQLGLVGVLLVIGVVISTFRASLKLQRRSPAYSTFGMCAMSAIVIMSVGESVFLGPAIAIIIVIRTLLLREATEVPRGVETGESSRRRAR